MPRNGSGIFSFPPSSWNPPVNGANATAADWANLLQDLANAITLSVASDGQTPMTGPLNMGGNRINNLGAPIGQNQALRWQQLAEGSNITSASTITIPNEGGLFLVTGTTTITELSGSYIGRRATLIFGDELTIQASPQLRLPGDSDYTTEPGDILEFIRINATTWAMLAGGGGGAVGGPGRTMVITESGSFVMPASRIWVTACGPGGSGVSATGGYGAGGGGGGAILMRREFKVTKGATVNALIGATSSTPNTYGTPTEISGLFTLGSGQTPNNAEVGPITGVGGLGGTASDTGTGGVSTNGATGRPGFPGSSLQQGGGGGAGGIGGGGAGATGSSEPDGVPGGVQFGNVPGGGGGSNANGGFGIGVGYGAYGGFAQGLNGGEGNYGAGGGGASGAGTGGAGGPGLIVIEW